jgi:hypothetical protein
MAFPVLADTLKCSLLANDPRAHAAYVALMQAHPQYTRIYVGVILSGMWLANLACALSSAEHHGAITKRQIGDLMVWLTAVVNTAAVTAIFRDEALAYGMWMLTWESARHALGAR